MIFVGMLAACGGGGGGRLIQELSAEPGNIPGTAWVTWKSDEEGAGTVRYGKAGALDESVLSESGTEHRVLLLTPQVGQTYTIQVDYASASGKTATSDEIEVDIAPPLQGSPRFTRTTWDPTRSCMDGGYVLMSWLGQNASGVGILDREGKYVWAYTNEVEGTRIARVRPGRDGQSLLWNINDAGLREDVAKIIRMGWDGEIRSETRTLWGHHDFIELPDGQIAWLGFDFRDLDILDDAPDAGVVNVAVDTILVDDEGVSDVATAQELFNFFDDVTTDIYDVRDRPGTDTEFLGPDVYEYSHANSLVYHEDDDAFLIMYRWLDALQKIDRGTGDLRWTWGNLPGVPDDLAGDDADRFIHSHMSEAWDDKLLVFDNHDPGPSMLKEYRVDEEAMTFALDWQYDSDRLETILGDVRRMPVEGCDNLLVSWSSQLRISEITRDGELVWDLSGDVGNAVSRVQFIPDLHDMASVAYPR